jgi:hypothetical protein
MFSSSEFRVFAFEDVPLDEDIFLMDEQWMSDRGAYPIAKRRGAASAPLRRHV